MNQNRLDGEPGWGLAVVAAVALAAGVLDRFVGLPSDRHALLLAALVAGVGLAGWRVAQRWDVAVLAALAAGVWAIPQAVPRHRLWVAAVPVLVLLVPGERLGELRPVAASLAAAALTAAVVVVLEGGLVVGAPAGALAFLFVLVRPDVPTDATLRALRTVALFAPGTLLLTFVAVNAGTGWFERATAAEALLAGTGLLGLLGLVSLAILGLATVLASSDPAQATAWVASAMALAVLVVVVPLRDVALLRAAGAYALGPLAVLAATAGVRVGSTHGRRSLGLALPLAASAVQIGLL